MEKVLKPFDIFFETKFKSLNDNEDESSLLEQARAAWLNLSAKKQTKFILKSQETFDSKEQNSPFYSYLTRRELELLFKAYGMPEKLPQNSRLYYIEKESVVEHVRLLQDARNSASEQWKTLSKEVKTAINNEFHQFQDKYIDEFFMFARNLPEARIPDYKHYLSISKKSEAQTESGNVLSSKTNSSKRIKENPFKAFIPFEIFIDKHRNHEIEEFVKLRSMYVSLPDHKKIKYIKKAEKRYDSSDLKDKPLFTSFLSKNEVQLLYESYGLPEIIPNQLSAYYMKKIYKTGIKDMKQVFNQFRKLNSQEKADLIDEHTQQLKEYIQKNQAFIDQLPSTRLEDYRQLKMRNPKSIKNGDDPGNVPKKKLRR